MTSGAFIVHTPRWMLRFAMATAVFAFVADVAVLI
jgi:hypothetical protein